MIFLWADFNIRIKTKTMSITLPNHHTEGKRLLFVKDKRANDEISLMTLPNHFESISCLSLNEMIRNFDNYAPLPDAILINLDSLPFNRIKSIVKALKKHNLLKLIPVIGLKRNFSIPQKKKLLQLGFSDCFAGKINWKTIEKRVTFLNKYKQELAKKQVTTTTDKPYSMPSSKRFFDIIVASSLLLVLSPLFLLVAILIKLESKGNIFYYSKRVGTGYQVFNFIKFRSMETVADARLMKLAKNNSYGKKNSETVKDDCTFYKIKDDPRVTFIGKIIRKTSIDELPQLINVLRGEMSIVGNRPLPLYEAQKLTCDDWAKRFMAPAGLTGLWQVDKRGKDNLNVEERIRLDMNYADNYSLGLDFKIMLRTLPAMLQRD